MDSMLCLDTSGSMAGDSLKELQRAVFSFLEYSEILEAKIGVAQFGQNTRVLVEMTTNYSQIKNCINNLSASGSTPMAEGLLIALKELAQRGRVIPIGHVTLVPRLILMTDGAPDSKEEVLVAAKLFGDAGIPISCVGVSGCDLDLMRKIAALSGGMFHYASQIEELSLFFLQQIILSLYIAEFAERLDELYSREILREYMSQKTGHTLSDEELDMFIAYLRVLTRVSQSTPPPRVQPVYQSPPRIQPVYQSPSRVQPVYQSHTTYATVGDEDVFPAVLIFILGWCGICCIWLGGCAYIKSANPTARVMAWLSIGMYGIGTLCGIIWIIYGIVVSIQVQSESYNNYYDYYYDYYYYY